MRYSKEQLLAYLSDHTISYTLFTHDPLFTCDQATETIKKLRIPGIPVKNLFLKDNKKRLFLISAAFDTKIDLKTIANALDAKGLRFADEILLMHYLGVTPGSVTPMALINDKEHAITFIIDASLLKSEYIQIHPLQNDATVVLQPDDLIRFLKSIQKTYIVYDF